MNDGFLVRVLHSFADLQKEFQPLRSLPSLFSIAIG